ncbi:hypothetical protein MSG28_011034 [Choristoneura fumiferana]|uniref:Uncharacterized protein n=1 Tax=Choristoneura fumiferana TaxID=7141 RepID=A0ACC0KRB4_CHOFU|nr:hypothetical protein MSG28_011034 [Choristoneura fumiferana]
MFDFVQNNVLGKINRRGRRWKIGRAGSVAWTAAPVALRRFAYQCRVRADYLCTPRDRGQYIQAKTTALLPPTEPALPTDGALEISVGWGFANDIARRFTPQESRLHLFSVDRPDKKAPFVITISRPCRCDTKRVADAATDDLIPNKCKLSGRGNVRRAGHPLNGVALCSTRSAAPPHLLLDSYSPLLASARSLIPSHVSPLIRLIPLHSDWKCAVYYEFHCMEIKFRLGDNECKITGGPCVSFGLSLFRRSPQEIASCVKISTRQTLGCPAVAGWSDIIIKAASSDRLRRVKDRAHWRANGEAYVQLALRLLKFENWQYIDEWSRGPPRSHATHRFLSRQLNRNDPRQAVPSPISAVMTTKRHPNLMRCAAFWFRMMLAEADPSISTSRQEAGTLKLMSLTATRCNVGKSPFVRYSARSPVLDCNLKTMVNGPRLTPKRCVND